MVERHVKLFSETDTIRFHLSSKGQAEFPKKLGPQGWDASPFATSSTRGKFQNETYENSRDLLDRLRDISPGYGRGSSAVHAYGDGHVWRGVDAGRRSLHVDGIFSRVVRLLDRAVFCLRNSGNCRRAGADAKADRRQRLAGCGELAVTLRFTGWHRDRCLHIN